MRISPATWASAAETSRSATAAPVARIACAWSAAFWRTSAKMRFSISGIFWTMDIAGGVLAQMTRDGDATGPGPVAGFAEVGRCRDENGNAGGRGRFRQSYASDEGDRLPPGLVA
jgi:hypothetical protein